jgi:carboxy-cis,cis-muconate cyclase
MVDEDTGGFGKKTQEVLFVPELELPQADKTRVALVSNNTVLSSGRG